MVKSKPATLKQIAERAGVQIAAASVVLNGAKSGTKVSEDTRAAILAAARELNYQPNAVARSLRGGRTGIGGLFSGYNSIDPRDLYIASVLSGIQDACTRLELDLLLYTPQAHLTKAEVLGNLQNGRMDGLIITGIVEPAMAKMLADSALAVVAIGDPCEGMPSVTVDFAEGGRLQARHLAERGHKRVLYRPTVFSYPSAIERYDAFCEEASLLGMHVVDGKPITGSFAAGTAASEAAFQLHPNDYEHLRGRRSCTAIQCWEDSSAYSTASQLSASGFRVPEDVAVVGFNGVVPPIEPRWRLTTVRAPWRRVGEIALETLNDLINCRDVPMEIKLPVEFVLGVTT